MNVLILTANFGHGHYSAAMSIKEKIMNEDSTNNVIIIDFVDYLFPKMKKIIFGTFNVIVNKCHTVYNLLNLLAPKNASAPLKRIVVEKIDKLIEENNIDKIISVVPLCSCYISAYKKMKNSNIFLATCITDIEVHPSWLNERTNLYLVASHKTKEHLISKNINQNKIIVSGIPVNSKFISKRKDTNKKQILIMGGGLGLIPNVEELLKNLDNNRKIKTTVILGNNKKLYTKLKNKYHNIEIVGFTNKVNEYMMNSNLIITKSGGITMFEAIHTKTPLIILKPFLIQEIGNAKYIEENGIGKVLWKNKQNLLKEIDTLVFNNEELTKIEKNMTEIKDKLDIFSYTNILNQEDLLC